MTWTRLNCKEILRFRARSWRFFYDGRNCCCCCRRYCCSSYFCLLLTCCFCLLLLLLLLYNSSHAWDSTLRAKSRAIPELLWFCAEDLTEWRYYWSGCGFPLFVDRVGQDSTWYVIESVSFSPDRLYHLLPSTHSILWTCLWLTLRSA